MARAPLTRDEPDGRWVAAVRSSLLAWYRREGRDLPWRATRDPYAVWVSEVMLQQTRVETVIPYYRRFLERFPDVATLAGADEENVLSLWSGLGYYRRARSLLAGARAVMENHGGSLPESAEALRRLPGIGRYTAGAIASIAFDRTEPVVDGNVRRVLSRLLARRNAPERLLWSVAGRLARSSSPGDVNQAIMELGATTCTPRNPDCGSCPVARRCAARAAGKTADYPARRAAQRAEEVEVAAAVVERGGRILLEKPGPGSPLRGTWDVPAVVLDAPPDSAGYVASAILERHGLELRVRGSASRVNHAILDRILRIGVFRFHLARGRVAGNPSLRWADRDELAGIPHSGATPKCLAPTLTKRDAWHH